MSEELVELCTNAKFPFKVFGNIIECHVLSDGSRVISKGDAHHVLNIINDDLEDFLNEIPGDEIPDTLLEEYLNPIIFTKSDGSRCFGYNVSLVVDVCSYLLELEKNDIPSRFHDTRDRCIPFMIGLAKVGTTALIDEATGYTEIRNKTALSDMMSKNV